MITLRKGNLPFQKAGQDAGDLTCVVEAAVGCGGGIFAELGQGFLRRLRGWPARSWA